MRWKSAGENSSADENSFQKLVAPNIVGGMTLYRGSSGDGQYGAFQRAMGDSTMYTEIANGQVQYNAVLNFSASASNSLYQSNSPLQVPASLCLVAIRF